MTRHKLGAPAIECPSCRSKTKVSNVRLTFLRETECSILGVEPGELLVDDGVDVAPEGGSHEVLLCTECESRWPLPRGIRVRWQHANGERTTIFGPETR